MSQCVKFHVAGWTWVVFTRVYLESCISLSPQTGNLWKQPFNLVIEQRELIQSDALRGFMGWVVKHSLFTGKN
jgi:hypothetical protein